MFDESTNSRETMEQPEIIGYSQRDLSEGVKPPVPEEKKKKKERGRYVKSALSGMVFGLFAALVFCVITTIYQKATNPPKVESAMQQETANLEETDEKEAGQDNLVDTQAKEDVQSQNATSILGQQEEVLTVSQIAKNAMPSIVSITTKGMEESSGIFGFGGQREMEGAGSGIIIGKNDNELLVATNNHVVKGADEIEVLFDDKDEKASASAKVKGKDAANDLAILAVKLEDIEEDRLEQIQIIALGDSDSLEVGDPVVAIGNALGYGQSVTTGIVSALNREVDTESYTATLIQTDAAINPGNSGGALLNRKGELVGINSAKLAAETVEGMGYAIPLATALPILDTLMDRETRNLASDEEAGFIGISCQDVTAEAAQMYGMPKGVYVAEVEKGGAAEKAGIHKGDIITKFDKIAVTSSSELRETISYYKVGEMIEVTIMRSNNGEYKEQNVLVTLAKSAAIEKQKLEQQQNGEDKEEAQNDYEQEPDSQNGNAYDFNFGDGFGEDEIPDWFRQFFDR